MSAWMLDELTGRLAGSDAEPVAKCEPGSQDDQSDAAVLASLPSVGRIVLATLFAEASA